MLQQYSADDLSNQEYHDSPGISSSQLKSVATEPLEKVHYKYFRDDKESLEPTLAMQLGTAVHCAVLEPDVFEMTYIDGSGIDGRTKAGKEAKAKYEEEGYTIIKNYDQVIAMRDAVLNHPEAAKLLKDTVREESFYWDDKKCRVDAYSVEKGYALDLKTAADASFDGFSRAILNFRYDIQGAHYLEGVGKFYPTIDRYFFICVEPSEPHAVAVYELDEVALEIGQEDAISGYYTLTTAIKNDVWPGYPTGKISLPQWYSHKRINEGE